MGRLLNGSHCALTHERMKPHIYFFQGRWQMRRAPREYFLNGKALRRCIDLNNQMRKNR